MNGAMEISFFFNQIGFWMEWIERIQKESPRERASERVRFRFLSSADKKGKRKKKRKTKYTILSSSIVAAGFISWFRYFMEAFDTVRCVSGRVCTVDD